MTKERIDKTLIVLDENELRQAIQLARQGNVEAIYRFVREVIAKKVEDVLRKRCR